MGRWKRPPRRFVCRPSIGRETMTDLAASAQSVRVHVPITGREVRQRLRQDRERLRAHYAAYGSPQPRFLMLEPSYICIWLHRWSAYNFQHGNRLAARLLWHINLMLTGADLSVISEIGPGLIIVHPVSTQIFGRIGANCTIWGHGGIGGGVSTQDIGAGAGLPIVGDNVTFSARSMVLGPVRIGDNCLLEPGVIVTQDAPSGSVIVAPQSRKIRTTSSSENTAHIPRGD